MISSPSSASLAGSAEVGGQLSLANRGEAEHTLMFREAAEAGDVVRRQRERNAEVIACLAGRLRANKPRAVVTLARGSSDHAATFARYLIETRAGILTSSASPSVGSIYSATPDLAGTMLLAISQSGRSPDLVNAAKQASTNGALLVAMVNDEGSPLAQMADVIIPLWAGPERSVAASKSFIASLAAILDLLTAWTEDRAIESALSNLPDKLGEAWDLDWTAALPRLTGANAMYVVGHGLGIAQEAALKLKETCAIHAEAFSAAEVRHGPMALVGEDFPVLLFGQTDESLESVAALAREFADRGAQVISAGVPGTPGMTLPVIPSDALTAPILATASFYRLANALALARGRDPDRPPHLAKVTETL
jgi:glucosamine--fructose-6-phosphate aminotransferase (isomerizing)